MDEGVDDAMQGAQQGAKKEAKQGAKQGTERSFMRASLLEPGRALANLLKRTYLVCGSKC